MKRILFAGALLLVVCGCAVPRGISDALEVQAQYTRVYVEATMPLLRSSGLAGSGELEGIGLRLIRNAEALSNWANGGKGEPNE